MKTGCHHLFVLWREPDAGRRYVIGELWQDHEGYAFGYGHDVERALDHGFKLLLELPELRPVTSPYRSTYLFSTFAQRIPSPRRPDYRSILDAWQVTSPDEPLDILAKSGGIQMTDRIEVAEYRSPEDTLQTPLRFRVAGEEHYDGSEKVAIGDAVNLVREPQNAYDPYAIMLMSLDGQRVGYVPRQYSQVVARCLDAGVTLSAQVERRLITSSDRDRWIVRLSRA